MHLNLSNICMCVYIYIHTYIYIHVYLSVRRHIYNHVPAQRHKTQANQDASMYVHMICVSVCPPACPPCLPAWSMLYVCMYVCGMSCMARYGLAWHAMCDGIGLYCIILSTYVHISSDKCMYVCLYVCVQVCMYVCMCVCACVARPGMVWHGMVCLMGWVCTYCLVRYVNLASHKDNKWRLYHAHGKPRASKTP